VADRGNGRVAVFGRDGSLVRSWGKAAQAGVTEPPVGEFVDLSDVAVGPDGTVYVMDLGANRLYLYTREGALKTSLDGGMLGTAVPNGIAVASNGDLFIASTAQSRVVVYANPSGLTEETKGNFVGSARIISGGSGPTNLEQPLDIVIDPANSSRAYIADVRDRIALIGADDVVTREWHLPTGRNDGVSRLAISPDGKTLYLSDPDRNRVAVIDVGTGAILYFGERGSGNGQFVSPSGIAVGTDGRIYVLDHGNGRVQVFAP
jgi:DNA-binding beta-propeller fold protein YncE